MPGDRVTFAFIPGAGIYPGVWRWTIAELQQRGHRGLVPWLPLDDPDAGPSAHADAVVAAIGEVWERPVVVGQSLGAFAAPLVAARIELAELVLVAPMIPAPAKRPGSGGEPLVIQADISQCWPAQPSWPNASWQRDSGDRRPRPGPPDEPSDRSAAPVR
jgi:pimeloyl-ACP methyl ester carboxylesterase